MTQEIVGTVILKHDLKYLRLTVCITDYLLTALIPSSCRIQRGTTLVKKIAAVISLIMGITLLTAMPASAAVPTLTSITPSNGTVSGGTSVTLAGTDFTGATGATIGGVAATDFTVVDSTTITMTTPIRAAASRQIGRYPVVVTHADGNSSELVYFDYTPTFEVSNRSDSSTS